jgi:hypothetical protein
VVLEEQDEGSVVRSATMKHETDVTVILDRSGSTRERVFKMISTQQEVYNCAFLFMAANQDAIVEGAKLGIAASHTRTFLADGPSFRSASENMSDAVASFRSTGRAELHNKEKNKTKKVH